MHQGSDTDKRAILRYILHRKLQSVPRAPAALAVLHASEALRALVATPFAHLPRYLPRIIPPNLNPGRATIGRVQSFHAVSDTSKPFITVMPPKQATLGYVKCPQQTLGCGSSELAQRGAGTSYRADASLIYRKFFGLPNGAGTKPQQSTLAFSRQRAEKPDDEGKGGTATIAQADNDDVEMKGGGELEKDHKSGDGELHIKPTGVKLERKLNGSQKLAEQSDLKRLSLLPVHTTQLH